MKLTQPQLELVRYVRDYQSMPERTRGVGDRIEAMGLVQNMYTAFNVWLITDAGMEAIAETEGRR